MEPSQAPVRQIFMDADTEHRYAGALESPPGYWFVRCDCGWSVRSLTSRASALTEYARHCQGLEWWESPDD